jgi:hypothetical protein
MPSDHLSDLSAPILQSLQDAYARGYEAGRSAAIAKIMASVQSEEPAQMVMDIGTESLVVMKPSSVEVRLRAPRGLAEHVIDKVLADKRDGMTIEDLETAVHEMDRRVSPKTVYNTLRKWEKMQLKYRRNAGRWYTIGNLPSPFARQDSPPKGETGGQQPPESSTLYSQGDPIQRDQGGGT